jgi:hypothetical protein
MTREIWLHIGLHKTGTSSFQKFCHSNRSALADADLCYPTDWVNHNDLYFAFSETSLNEDRIRRLHIKNIDELHDWIARKKMDFESEMRASKCSKILVSGEKFSDLTCDGAKSLIVFLQTFADIVKVLTVVREPISFANSYASENIKGGSTLAEETEHPPLAYYKRRIAPYLNEVGHSNISVLNFDNLFDNGSDLIRSMLQTVGIDVSRCTSIVPVENKSLTQAAAEILSLVNEHWYSRNDRYSPPPRFPATILNSLTGRNMTLPPQAIKQVMEKTLEDVIWIEREFGISFCINNDLRSDNLISDQSGKLSVAAAMLLESNILIDELSSYILTLQSRK